MRLYRSGGTIRYRSAGTGSDSAALQAGTASATKPVGQLPRTPDPDRLPRGDGRAAGDAQGRGEVEFQMAGLAQQPPAGPVEPEGELPVLARGDRAVRLADRDAPAA